MRSASILLALLKSEQDARTPKEWGASQCGQLALIPQPLLPKWEKGSRIQSPSPPPFQRGVGGMERDLG
jgi:hypothetical protein